MTDPDPLEALQRLRDRGRVDASKTERPFMDVVCAWCKRLIRVEPVDMPSPAVSHGICPECFKKEIPS